MVVSGRRATVEDLLAIALHVLARATLAVFHFFADVFGILGDVIVGLFAKEDDDSPNQL
jgi:hypothetical protein